MVRRCGLRKRRRRAHIVRMGIAQNMVRALDQGSRWIEHALDEVANAPRLGAALRLRVRRARKVLRRGRKRWLSAEELPLGPREALARNGFFVQHALFPRATCTELAAAFRARHRANERGEFTSIDAANRIEGVRELLFDPRVIALAEQCLGGPPRFLQISDLQMDHDHVAWHRDSAYRDMSGLDWDESTARYGVVKILIYLESEGAGLAVAPGSHVRTNSSDEVACKRLNSAKRSRVLQKGEGNEAHAELGSSRPLVFCAEPGDAIVIDERIYHRGRRVSEGAVTGTRDGKKLTVSFVFGLDNVHSYRMHSTFRYARRDLSYRDMRKDLMPRLDRAGLALADGYGNYFQRAPRELEGVWLRHPEQRAEMIASLEGV